jgi:acyl-CoA thioesterase-1
MAVKVVNASISGDTTSGGATRLPMLLSHHKPQILIVELGGNDGLRGLPLDAIRKNLHIMIAAARKAGCQVLLLGMQIPPNYGKTYTTGFAEIYGQIASETKIRRVPFFLKGVAEKDSLFQPDRIHPVKEAQPGLLKNVWQYLQPLLK